MNLLNSALKAALFALLLVSVSCSPGRDAIARKVASGAWYEAMEMTGDKPERQRMLAALIVGESVKTDAQGRLAGTLLLRADRIHGRAVLKEIRGDRPKEAAAELATVALATLSRVSNRNAERWLRSEQTDVRALTLATVARRLSDETLIALTLDTAPEVRSEAIRELCVRKPAPTRAATLANVLRLDPEPSVRAQTARCGSALDDRSLDALVAAFNDNSPAVQEAVIRGVGQQDSDAATALLRQWSSGTLSPAGVLASVELMERDDPQGMARFRQALQSADRTVRATALAHLTRLKLADADDIRVQALSDPEQQIQFLSAQALLSDSRNRPRARDVLAALRDSAGPWAEPALQALARSGVTKDIQTLQDRFLVLDNDPARLASQIHACSDISFLAKDFVRLMGHADARVRTAAAFALLSNR